MCQQELGERGKPAFYQGRVGQAIVDVIGRHGGVMTLDDLSSHDSEVIVPASTEYKVRSAAIDASRYLCFNMSVSRVNDSIVCSGRVSVGAAT